MQREIDQLANSFLKATQATGTRPVRRVLLTRGDGTGALIATSEDRTIWVRDTTDQSMFTVYLPPNSVVPYIDGDPTLETVEARVGYPAGISGMDNMQVLDFFTKAGKLSIGNMSPMENLIYKAYYKQSGDISTLRARPMAPPILALAVDGPYLYRNLVGAWADFGILQTVSTDIATAITALAGNKHQLGIVYLNRISNALGLALNTAATYSGTLPSRGSWVIADALTLLNSLPAAYLPISAVYLYDAQPTIAEADFYRDWPLRDLFGPPSTGAGVSGKATLVGGTITVNTVNVTATSLILLTPQETGALAGIVRVSARVAGTSFTITSSNAGDTADVAWLVINP